MLAPCPFCPPARSAPTMVHGIHDGWVQCQGCSACGPRRSSDAEATTDWNKRALIEITDAHVRMVQHTLTERTRIVTHRDDVKTALWLLATVLNKKVP